MTVFDSFVKFYRFSEKISLLKSYALSNNFAMFGKVEIMLFEFLCSNSSIKSMIIKHLNSLDCDFKHYFLDIQFS